MKEEPIKIRYSEPGDTVYSPQIHQLYKKEAENGDIGLAVRSVSYLNAVISEGKGVFAFMGIIWPDFVISKPGNMSSIWLIRG